MNSADADRIAPAALIVQPGDTIFTAAARFGVVPEALRDANPGINPYRLWVGQRLLLPTLEPERAPVAAPVPIPVPERMPAFTPVPEPVPERAPVAAPVPVSAQERVPVTEPAPPSSEAAEQPATHIPALSEQPEAERPLARHTVWAQRDALRKIWLTGLAALRAAQTSALHGLPDRAAAADRLLRTASDLAALLSPLWGGAAAARFGALLHDFLLLTLPAPADAVRTAPEGIDASERRLLQCVDGLAASVHGASPGVDEASLRGMLLNLSGLARASMSARREGSFSQEIALFDRLVGQGAALADAMAEALAADSTQPVAPS